MMTILLILAIVLVVALVTGMGRRRGAAAQSVSVDDARAEAQRWYERLGGQLMNLHADNPAATQALADASERYNAAGGQLQQAASVRQFELARETALEGLTYVRAARTAMGLDPGPEIPPLAATRNVGQLTSEREVNVQGHTYRAGPQPGAATPYYYPGGLVGGRPIPGGWYSQPLWKTALASGAGALGGMLIFDALFSPAFGDGGWGHGGFGGGWGNDMGANDDWGGNDLSGGGDFGGGNDFGGGGDWGGGDFGGDF